MQTFLPYSDFIKSAQTLDYRRLGKQRVEALQLLIALGDKWVLQKYTNKSSRWQNHPAAKMWKGHTEALSVYMNIMIAEWINRGYNNNMAIRSYLYNEFFTMDDYKNMVEMPSWLGDPNFHSSHRSNLLRKDFNHYSQFGWSEKPNLHYVWPQ